MNSALSTFVCSHRVKTSRLRRIRKEKNENKNVKFK